ncbi:MAG TPA: Dyp-type peroxidase [Micromonosporaceae bacterium]
MTQPRSDAPQSAPQSVLSPLTDAAVFLVATINAGAETAVRDLLSDLSGLIRSVGFRLPAAGLTAVAGIGADAWDRLYGEPRPEHLHPFRPLNGDRHSAPATDGDLLFHIRAAQMDVCFELATQIGARLAGIGTIVDEVHGFKYFDERDLLGFVDGTENPAGRAAYDAVTVPDGAHAGGSYVIVQKYVHDMAAWNALSVEDQERVIGRTNLANIELPDDVKPDNSHVALNTVVSEDGEELQILRDNMPFGSVALGEFGTYYIAYARDPGIIETMLSNMFVGNPPGNYDRILDFSTARTGCLFFAPVADFLDDPPGVA